MRKVVGAGGVLDRSPAKIEVGFRFHEMKDFLRLDVTKRLVVMQIRLNFRTGSTFSRQNM